MSPRGRLCVSSLSGGRSDDSSGGEASLGRGAQAEAVAERWRQSGRRPGEFHGAV